MLPSFTPAPPRRPTTALPTLQQMLEDALRSRGLSPNSQAAQKSLMDRTNGLGYDKTTFGKLKDTVQDIAALSGSSYNSLLASLTDIGPAGNPVSEYLKENARLYDANVSKSGKYKIERNAAEMALLAPDDYIGQAKTTVKQAIKDPGVFTGKAIGNIAGAASMGVLATAAAPEELSAVALARIMGGMYTVGADRGGAYDTIMSADERDLAGDPTFAGTLARTGSVDAARKALADKAGSYAENPIKLATSTALGALLGGFGADPKWLSILTQAEKGAIARTAARAAAKSLLETEASKGMVKEGVKTGFKEVLSEALDEANQQLTGNLMAGAGGANINPMEGVVQSGVEAGMMTAPSGVAAGPTGIAQARMNLAEINAQDAKLQEIGDRNLEARTVPEEPIQNIVQTPDMNADQNLPQVQQNQEVTPEIVPAPPPLTVDEAAAVFDTRPPESPQEPTGEIQAIAPQAQEEAPTEPPAQPEKPSRVIPEEELTSPGTALIKKRVIVYDPTSPKDGISNGYEAIVYNAVVSGKSQREALQATGLDEETAKKIAGKYEAVAKAARVDRKTYGSELNVKVANAEARKQPTIKSSPVDIPENPDFQPFYSQLRKVVDDEKTPKIQTPGDWINFLSSPQRGVKSAEIHKTGLYDFLADSKDKKVSRETIQKFLDDNETKLGYVVKNKADRERLNKLKKESFDLYQSYGSAYSKYIDYRDTKNPDPKILSDLNEKYLIEQDKYESKQIEVRDAYDIAPLYNNDVLTLPGGKNYREKIITLPKEKAKYVHQHWPGIKNPAVHVRLDDRIIDGKKVLFVQEIQSDWGQKGRRSGFDKNKNRFSPDSAPFVENTEDWTALALKDILHEAAVGGYDAIAWTSGKMQAERGGRAEGHIEYYDKIVPSVLKRLVKKFGISDTVHIGSEKKGSLSYYTDIDNPPGSRYYINDNDRSERIGPYATSEERDKAATIIESNRLDFHRLDLTPVVRAVIKREGFPLYSMFGENKEKTEKQKLLQKNYNGIHGEFRERNYQRAQLNQTIIKGGNGTGIADIELDAVPEAVDGLILHGRLAYDSQSVFNKIVEIAGVKTARFGGFIVAGNLLGVNYGTDEEAEIRINPLVAAKRRDFDKSGTAVEIVTTLVHEIAHQVYDPGDHSPEIFMKEMSRIMDAIQSDMGEMVAQIEDSLHMNSLKRLVAIQQPGWDGAIQEAHRSVDAILQRRNKWKGVLEDQANEKEGSGKERTLNNGVSESGDINRAGGPGEGEVYDRGAGKRGDQRAGSVSEVDRGTTGGLAEGPDTARSNEPAASKPEGIKIKPIQIKKKEANIADPVKDQVQSLPDFDWVKRLEEVWVDKYNRLTQVFGKEISDRAVAATPSSAMEIRQVKALHHLPLVKLLAKHDINVEDFEDYLIAANILDKRGMTTIERKGDLPMTFAEAQKIVDSHKGDIAYRDAHDIVRDLSAYQRAIMKAGSGLASAEDVDQLSQTMGRSYVPWKTGEVHDGYDSAPEYIGGLQVKGREWIRSMGTKTKPGSVLASLFEQVNRTIVRKNHNEVLNALAEFIEKNPSRYWSINKKDADPAKEVMFKRNGKAVRIYVDDPVVSRQIKGMKPNELNMFLSRMSGFTHLYSKLSTTYNFPQFPIMNLMRDLPLGFSRIFVNEDSGAVKAVASRLRSAIKAINDHVKDPSASYAEIKDPMRKTAKLMQVSGGVVSYRDLPDAVEIKSNIAKDIKKYKPGVKGGVSMVASNVLEYTSRINEVIETAIRVAYADYLYEQEEKRSGKSRFEFADKAAGVEIAAKTRALTGDFQRGGEISRTMGALYPFFKASVQGGKAVYELMAKAAKGDKKAIMVFSTLAALGIAEDIIASSVSGDDDDDGISDYDSMPDWMRRQKFVIPAAGGKSVLLPMTYGLSVAVNFGKMLSRTSRGEMTAGDFGREMAAAVEESTNPIGGSATFLQMISPLATDWIVQVAENKDWKGQKLFPERYPGQSWMPNSELVNKRDSAVAKNLASGINTLTGGSSITKGALSETPFGDLTPYPGAIDAFGKWIGGGIGRVVENLGQSSVDLIHGKPIDRIPIVSSFIASPQRAFYMGRFYEQLKDLKETKAQMNAILAGNRRESLKAEIPELSETFDMATNSELQAMMPAIRSNPELLANFKKIGLKKLKFMDMYDSIAKKIKNIELSGDPNGDERITEMVIAANKRLAEAGL